MSSEQLLLYQNGKSDQIVSIGQESWDVQLSGGQCVDVAPITMLNVSYCAIIFTFLVHLQLLPPYSHNACMYHTSHMCGARSDKYVIMQGGGRIPISFIL